MKHSIKKSFRNKINLIVIKLGLMSLFLFFNSCTNKESNQSLTFLKTQGQNIVNEKGEQVLLKSVGLGNWLLPEGYMWKFGSDADRPRRIEKVIADLIGEEQAAIFWKEFRANYITEADIIRIKELGFNSVRVALNSRLFIIEDETPVFVEEGFLHLENLVQWCKKHQLYVIIDMHGAPGGQTGANIDDSPNDLPELFMDKKNEEALFKLWIEIVNRYKDEPTVAAYDLLNEPLPERTGAAKEYGHLVEPLYKKLTQEIRKRDSRHMITLEGINWANDWSIFEKPFDENLLYQFHYYCWDNPDYLKDIDYFLKLRDTLNAPIWVGETGEKANTIYWGTMQYFEKNNVGWSFWPWKKMDTKNTPYSIEKPENWDLIAEYTKGGNKPDSATAQNILNEYLNEIELANCTYFEDVTNAIFRRIPGKIEAENYLQGELNETYFVADTSKKSSYYRTKEFVPIKLIAIDSTSHDWKWYTEQGIALKLNEWTKYSTACAEQGIYSINFKARANVLPAKLKIEYDDNFQVRELNDTLWNVYYVDEIALENTSFDFKLIVTEGEIDIDWVSFE